MQVSREETRKVCPFAIEKSFSNKFRVDKRDITSVRDVYVVRATTPQQFDEMAKLTTLLDMSCEVTDKSPILKRCNSSKGLIYVSDYDVKHRSAEDGLKNRYSSCEVTQATWIKNKTIKSTPFLIILAQSSLPAQICIPREQSSTHIYRYRQRPLFLSKLFGIHVHPQEV